MTALLLVASKAPVDRLEVVRVVSQSGVQASCRVSHGSMGPCHAWVDSSNQLSFGTYDPTVQLRLVRKGEAIKALCSFHHLIINKLQTMLEANDEKFGPVQGSPSTMHTLLHVPYFWVTMKQTCCTLKHCEF